MTPTRSSHDLALNRADFPTLCAALDYAAAGETGVNFFDARGACSSAQTYGALRDAALLLARRLQGLGIAPGGRIALVADSTPDFVRFFWACQYAGLVPVPLPATMNVGGRAAYVTQLRQFLVNCGASAAMAPDDWSPFLIEAAQDLDLALVGAPQAFDALVPVEASLPGARPDSTAYIQYTSGSTRFPRGVVIDHATVLANIRDMAETGLALTPSDRLASWLPFFHDMGLVAFIIMGMATQRSVDFLGTHDFARRPRKWLEIMSANGTTVTSAPPFAYELSVMRLRAEEAAALDLSKLRVACVGAELIHPAPLQRFADALEPAGFRFEAFLPCYGMAETSLGISFVGLDETVRVDRVSSARMQREGIAEPVTAASDAAHITEFVDCGRVLPSYEVAIRDEHGTPLPERHAGVITLRGPSVMRGYHEAPDMTRQTLDADGWLDTGDIGYLAEGRLYITGRKKDMMIIHGRNIWPQDLEQIAKTHPGVYHYDVAAFSVPTDDGQKERAVLVLQCRVRDATRRAALCKAIIAAVRAEYGIDCEVELVPTRTLPRTSSGKLARARARLDYMERQAEVAGASKVKALPRTRPDTPEEKPLRYIA